MARPVEYGALYELLDDFGKGVVDSAQSNLRILRRIGGKQRRRVASGNLLRSLAFDLKRKGQTSSLRFFATGSADVYADFIEEGVNGTEKNQNAPYSFRKGRVPFGAIYKWIKDKGIKPRNVDDPNRMKRSQFTSAGKESKKRGREVTQEDLLRQMAARMAVSIARKGITGIHYFEEAVETELDKRGPDFRKTIEKIIEDVLNKRNKK